MTTTAAAGATASQFPSPPLPSVTSTPTRHHHSCLSISTNLLDYLCGLIWQRDASVTVSAATSSGGAHRTAIGGSRGRPRRDDDSGRDSVAVVLSVGSGTGLVERLLWERLADGVGHWEWAGRGGTQGRAGGTATDVDAEVEAGDAGEEAHPSSGSKGTTAPAPGQQEQRSANNLKGRVQVYGIEVPPPPAPTQAHNSASSDVGASSGGLNAYLPPSQRITVRGTWDTLTPAELLELMSRRSVGEGTGRELDPEYAQPPPKMHDDCGRPGFSTMPILDTQKEPHGSQRPSSKERHTDEHGHDETSVGVVLLFIYPRQPSLLRQYITAYSAAVTDDASQATTCSESPARTQLKAVIWAGPRADWVDYDGIFTELERDSSRWDVSVKWGAEAGLSEWEGVAVAHRTSWLANAS